MRATVASTAARARRFVSDSWRTIARNDVAAAALTSGMRRGSASRSPHSRASPIGTRSVLVIDIARDFSGTCCRRCGGGFDLGWQGLLGSVAFEVEELQRESHSALAVHERVVKAHEQRGTTARDSFDDDHLPQRARAVERVSREQRGEVVELALVTRRREREPSQVIAEIEVVIVDPHRRLQPERRLHALAQTRHDAASRGSSDARAAPCPARYRGRSGWRPWRTGTGPSRAATSGSRCRTSEGSSRREIRPWGEG